jgi:hypothetical protein
MALQSQIISIPMSLGIDTENAPPLVDNQRFSLLTDVVFNKDSKGQLHKRSGHTALPTAIQGGGVIPAAELIEVFNDETGVICSDGNLYGFSSTGQNWVSRGQVPLVSQVETNIAAGAFSVANPDACVLNGLVYYTYEMSGDSWVKIVDDANKSVKATIRLGSLTGSPTFAPKILAVGDLEGSTGTGKVASLSVDSTGNLWLILLTGTSSFSVTNLSSTIGTLSLYFQGGVLSKPEAIYDAIISNPAGRGAILPLCIVCVSGSALKGYSFSINISTVTLIQSTTIVASLPLQPNSGLALSVTNVAAGGVSNGILTVTWQPSTGGLIQWQQYVDIEPWTAGSSSSAGSSGLLPCPRLTTVSVPSGGSAVLGIFYEQPSSATALTTIYFAVGASHLWSTGCNIAGQPFVIGSNIYLPVVYSSSVQQSLFLTMSPASSTSLALVAGRYFTENNAGSAPTNYRMGAPFNVSVTSASLAVMVQPQGSSATTVAASLAELALNFTTPGDVYLIPSDANTIVHVNATDLNSGTAKTGPDWVSRGHVPYSAIPTPAASVGPFAIQTYQGNGLTPITPATDNGFTLPAPNPLNIASSFSVTALVSVQPYFPISNTPTIIDSGDLTDFNFFDMYIETSGPSVGKVGFAIGTATLSTALEDSIPYYNMVGLLVISAGYDASTNNVYLKVNSRPTIVGNLGGSYLASSTPAVIGNYDNSGTTSGPFNGNVYEVLVSTDKPSDMAFSSIYNQVLKKITVGPAQFAQLGGNMHIACGSQLMDYDGTNLVEHNFHIFPETPTVSYLSSQLTVIVDSYNPLFIDSTGATTQGSFRIAVPDNAANPGGPIGQLITPGEYITFGACSQRVDGTHADPESAQAIIYFVVNGVGSAPSGTGAGAIFPCSIQTTSTSTQVAQAIWGVINSSLTTAGNYILSAFTPATQANTFTPQYVKFTTYAFTGIAVVTAPPCLSRYSSATQVYAGATSPAGTATQSSISFPPAKLVSTGQYASFTTPFAGFSGFTEATVYFWFSNPSNPTIGNETKTGGDPIPFGSLTGTGFGGLPASVKYSAPGQGNYFSVQVSLLGTEDEQGVATKVQTAMANVVSILSGSAWNSLSVGRIGNVVTFDAVSGANPDVLPANYPTTNVGLNYVGANVTGVGFGYSAIQYTAVYEWIDAQNQLQQSSPSVVPAIAYIPFYTATGGGSIGTNSQVPISMAVQLSVNPTSLTLKTSVLTGTDLDIAIYRTISGATVGNEVFYRITPPSQLLFNQPASTAPITYADFSSDGVGVNSLAPGQQATGIQANQLLYTTGGVQPNSAPPACSYVINHQNRLWIAGLENPNELWYSEIIDSGFGVAFTQEQIALVNPTVGQTVGGNIIALASMDSNLIVFQENQVWFIQGSGPDPTGGNGFFAAPQIVASSSKIGCRDVNSVVLQPNGVMFKSTQGFWLLGRDLSLKYVGAAVKTFNSDIVSSAVALASNSQINFLSASGMTLMYDWYYDSWSTFSTNGTDSVIDESGTFNMITETGAVWVQTPGMFVDGDGTPVTMSIQTAWLKPGNVSGFQRVWKAFLEGQFFGSQPYLVQIAYNYNPTVVDTFILNAGSGSSSIGTWGGSSTWGATIWGEDGGTATVYADQIQIRVYPSNQLCDAIQFTITDLTPVPASQTWSLNALDLELGIRRGGMKRIGNPQSLG